MMKRLIGNFKTYRMYYSIYMITCSFMFAIFYTFHSLAINIESQTGTLTVSEILGELGSKLSSISFSGVLLLAIVLSYIHFFLVNHKLKEVSQQNDIKKKEFIRSSITELLFVLFIALAIGSVLGMIASPLFTEHIMTIMRLEQTGNSTHLLFLPYAFKKAIVLLSMCIFIVICTNVYTVYRYEYLKSLYNKNSSVVYDERLLKRKTNISYEFIFLSVAFLLSSYIILPKNEKLLDNANLYLSGVLGIIGTILLVITLEPFMESKLPKRFLFGSNFFKKQLYNLRRVKIIHVSIGIILFFFAITFINSGLNYIKIAYNRTQSISPYGLTLQLDGSNKQYQSTEEELASYGISLEEFGRYELLPIRITKSNLKAHFENMLPKKLQYSIDPYNDSIRVVAQSDYERAMKLSGKEPLPLQENESILLTNHIYYYESIEEFLKIQNEIMIAKRIYNVSPNLHFHTALITSTKPHHHIIAVLADEHTEKLPIIERYVNVQYNDEGMVFHKQKHQQLQQKLIEIENQYGEPLPVNVMTRYGVYKQMHIDILSKVISGVYAGMILIVLTTTLLATTQLMSTYANKKRYSMLKRIGVPLHQLYLYGLREMGVLLFLPIVMSTIYSGAQLHYIVRANGLTQYELLPNNIVVYGTILFIYSVYVIVTMKESYEIQKQA